MALFKTRKTTKTTPQLPKTFDFPIVGMQFFSREISAAGTPTKGYNLPADKMELGKAYYKFWFNCDVVQLVPEPHNKVDKNAIAVYINAQKVGFVPANLTGQVRQYLPLNCAVSAVVHGGPSRCVVDGQRVDIERQFNGSVTISLQ